MEIERHIRAHIDWSSLLESCIQKNVTVHILSLRSKCDDKITQSEDNEKKYRDQIAGASDGDK